MKYSSTRGGVADLTFSDALLMGLASDGGLLLPDHLPQITNRLQAWRGLDFVGLAQEVIALFVDDIERATLDQIVADAFSSFDHDDVVALKAVGDIQILELFHGPTLAFKDVALQLLGRLFEHTLAQRGTRLNILGATSGDTGSAAIAGVRGQPNIDIFILYPQGKVSPLQEKQMTTIADDNVHCIAVEGSFDDCQGMMKSIFNDLDFKADMQLGAVNSVNWARVLAQIVYYGYASLRHSEPTTFCVPTGNFGNVFAAYLARRMGFPIAELVVATNENDILARFFDSGVYARGDVHFTLSPAMDIQVASNFERFLYYHFEQDSEQLKTFMLDFQNSGRAALDGPPRDFHAVAINTAETLAAIQQTHAMHEYVLDPHTAVGVAAAHKVADRIQGSPVCCVATAHPAKFPDAVGQALPGVHPSHPRLDALSDLPERKSLIEADIEQVKSLLRTHAH